MIKNKVVDLQQYKNQKILEKQLKELDQLAEEHYEFMSPVERKGYRNFVRLLEALDANNQNQSDDGV